MHLRDKTGVKIQLDLYGVLKNFKKEDHYTIPVFIPHKGCRNECVFCNQRSISGQIEAPTYDDVKNTIEKYLGYIKDKKDMKNVEVAFFGGSFTGLNINDQIGYLKVANEFLISGKINGIRLSTRPDYIRPMILNILKKYGVTTIEIGVQSMDNDVLQASKRGHLNTDTIRASKLIKLWGFNLGHQIMIGLPKSTENIEKSTMEAVARIAPNELRIYPVYILEESELYEMYKEGKYEPLTLDEAIKRVLSVMHICMQTNIKVIRIGLQATETITKNNSHVLGPVCDNFAEYVLAGLAREKMEEEILKRENISGENITFEVEKRYTSIVIGPKKINKDYFLNKYNVQIGVNEI